MSVREVGLRSPVDLAKEAVAPEHAVGGDIHVDGHSVFLRGNDLRVVPLHQVNTPDLVSVSEHQVGTFTCMAQQNGFNKTSLRFSCSSSVIR